VPSITELPCHDRAVYRRAAPGKFNTLFQPATQEDQIRCFQNVAKHLTADGLFVVEAFVPSYLTRLRDYQYVDAEQVGIDHVKFDVGPHDPVVQRLDGSHVVLSLEGVRFFPIVTAMHGQASWT